MRSARGFTLLELMVGLAVIGILVSLGVSTYSAALVQRRRTGAVRELYAEALRARQLALSRGQPVRLVVRDVEQGGRFVSVAQYERLPCDDDWGAQCPALACETSLCGAPGCACPEVGREVELPAGLTQSGLDGVCFLGGSGRPRKGRECRADSAPAPPAYFEGPEGISMRLDFNPLNGITRLVDCRTSPLPDGAPCP